MTALMEADDQRTCSGNKHRLETEETVAMSAGFFASQPARRHARKESSLDQMDGCDENGALGFAHTPAQCKAFWERVDALATVPRPLANGVIGGAPRLWRGMDIP
jgi:hypothetical protein